MNISLFLSNLQQPLTESITGNTLLTALIAVLGLFNSIFGFVEFFDDARPIRLLVKALILTLITIALCVFVKLVFALSFMMIAIFFMILHCARKRNKEKTQKIQKIMDGKEIRIAQSSGLTASREYMMAEKCIAEERPKEAIAHLLKCRGKITGMPKFFISYADALIQLNNFSGALVKLNDIPKNRLKTKDTFIHIMVRKIHCYHGLHEYEKELECCNALLAKNIQPDTYYFYRGKVKLRMLEVASCLRSVEKAIANGSNSRQDFMKGIFNDLDKAQHYSKQDEHYEGEILSYKGACYIYLDEYQKGWDVLIEAQKKNEFCPTAYVYLGICQYEKKDLFQAIEKLRMAISYDEGAGAASDMACYYLAKIYYKTGEYDNAIRYAAQSLSIFSKRSECFRIQGNCYRKKLMYKEAIECYSKAIELKPEATYYADRALCYYNGNKESEKAYYDMQEAIKLDDKSNYRLDALLYKADMDRKKRIQKDKTELNGLLAPFEDNPDNFVSIALIYYTYQHFEEAQQYYRRAIENNPKNCIAHYDLALLLQKMELTKEAVDEFKIAIELEPLDVKAYKQLADCYRDMGDLINETLTLGRLEEVEQSRCEINKNNGDDVYHLNKYQMAVDYYQAALMHHPSPAAFNNLACAYYAQELYGEAIESLEKAIKLDKQYFLAYFNLGNCQLRMSESGSEQEMKIKAKENFRAAHSLNMEFKQASLMLKSMNAENIEMLIDVPSHG